ncbi:nucleotidyl transferase AbiEii/AbiGii toxin family protein [Streptomyces chilikensis]|uniref:nucleotidyl transferase AbiEii/AbiGii toxin family protein n=1 Tax=Streptomyces chilikensis TaxID=1194079 RepID=UPI001F1138CE|nr:nucleotidyl transferase AbiEii/AbiGii toxin family protein [Streptomyces chilikensis]
MSLTADTAGWGGWRFSVEAHLAGKLFAGVRVNVVDRGEESARTERIPLPNTLGFAGTPQRVIEAVDRRQHFAEKLHAFTRDYGDRPDTRVKDLVDLVLLAEDGLPGDAALVQVVRHVFAVRATHEVPDELEEPPPRWRDSYPELARELATGIPPTLDATLGLVRGLWAAALADASLVSSRPEQKDRLG